MSGPTFTAGRDNKGAFATGARSSATATISETNESSSNVNIQPTLAGIREILTGVPGLDPKALTWLDEASEEAEKAEPDRDEVGRLVNQAAQYAKKAAGFAVAAERLAPHLQQVGAWVGSVWQQLTGAG
jgi:hypothetical protein